MPGKLPGMYFQFVISSMLDSTSQMLFPEFKQRIAQMDANTLYSWDEFTDMMQTIAAKLPAAVLVSIGRRVIEQSKDTYLKQGFTSADAVLKDWSALFNTNIRGAPARDLVRTESYAPGKVSIIAGIAQPVRLVEGYLRGVVEIFGGSVVSLTTAQFVAAGATYNRIEMTWTKRR